MPKVRLAALLPAAMLAATLPVAAQEAAEGDRLFRARCASCHSLGSGPARIGPDLVGVMGRAAGGLEGARVSPALKASGLTWDAATLDAYLANPRQTVPGTTMTVALPDAGQRAAVIAYLTSLPAPQ